MEYTIYLKSIAQRLKLHSNNVQTQGDNSTFNFLIHIHDLMLLESLLIPIKVLDFNEF